MDTLEMSLSPGTRLRTETSQLSCVVDDLIGEGGQGSVYRVSVEGERLALKWYYPQWLSFDHGLRARLEYMVDRGSPSDRYLWPIELVSDGSGSFGYVMAYRPENLKDLTALFAGRIGPSFRAIATAGFELAHNFHELHSLGLSYQDISSRNVFIDQDSGAIAICDCDNVSVNNVPSAIGGTVGYIAPEVGLRDAVPSGDTDRYSLAVLLFEMLMLHHPLLGAHELRYPALTAEALLSLHYHNPLFIFDPENDSNAPVPGRHDRALQYWAIYPKFIKELFVHAFTRGLREPKSRIYERKWRSALLQLRDAILRCEGCGAENFHDDTMPDRSSACWCCATTLVEPIVLQIGEQKIVLNTDTQLHAHHVDPLARYDFERVVATVSRHPQQADVFGLRNDSGETWTATAPNGDTETIGPRRVVRIGKGTSIAFGRSTGVIA